MEEVTTESCYCGCDVLDCGVRVGQKVPDFELETFEPASGTFGKFSLMETRKNKKWTVLVFYPADFTFICPTELADLAAKQGELGQIACEIVSVSTDTKFVHYGWYHQEKLLENVKYHMAADPKRMVCQLFGVYDEGSGLALRGTFIIDPDGVLVGSEVNYFNVGRNADELVRKMKAFDYVRSNPAEVCPAKWEPGGKTLKPSEEIVGKVYEEMK
jgi:peroxiredoxin (alkyl hydroperoxide reductase subunit C)